jgi:MFS family permease
VSSAISALISTPVGWLMDHHGIRGLYLLGVALMAGSSLLYALAHDWRLLFGAALFASIAMRLNGTGCRVICADSVVSRDRVTAQNVCGTLASIVGMVAPLIAAHLVTLFGGMTVEGIRPLYYLQLGGYGIVFLVVAHQLREPQPERLAGARDGHGFLDDFRLLFTGRRDLGRWIAISALTSLPMAVF